MSNLELRIEEEASLNLTFGESSDMSFDAVDFVGVPFAPTVEVEDIEGGHRVSITSMGAEGKKTDEFDVMDGADGATGQQGPKGDSYEITAADYAEIAEVVEEDIQDVIDAAQDATADATAAAAEARAASAATWLSGNVLFGELAEGAVLTADDVYAAPARDVSVYGVSTQAETPTPDAPVPIESVDDLTLMFAGKNLLDLSEWASGFIDAANGSITSSNTAHYTVNYSQVIQGSYMFTMERVTAATNTVRLHGYDKYKRWLRQIYTVGLNAGTGVFSHEVTIPDDVKYVRMSCRVEANQFQLELGSTATDYAPYIGQSVQIPLGNHIARSLPDGTRDTLTLSYLRPSTEHEGWGVFGMQLTQNVDTGTVTSFTQIYTDNDSVQRLFGTPRYRRASQSYNNRVVSNRFKFNFAAWQYGTPGQFNCDDVYCFAPHTFADLAEANAWLAENPITLQFPIATPITHDLGTVELPVLPCPLTAWADGGSAQPTMQLEYERALSIVIPRIEAQLADMATS